MPKYIITFIASKNNKKYITMYDLSYNDFFKLLLTKPKIAKQLEKYMREDIKNQENIIIDESIIDLWKNNLSKKNRFCILIYKNNYIGSFRYIKKRFENVLGNNLYSEIYIKIMIVYIIPDYRGKGIAQQMLNKIINKKNNYLLIVSVNNKKALSLYNKFGFKNLGGIKDNSLLILKNNIT